MDKDNKQNQTTTLPQEIISLLNHIDSVAFTKGVRAISAETWVLSDEELEEKIAPSKTMHAFREAFWRAIRRSLEDGRKITLPQLTQGVCSYTHAYDSIIGHPERLAWILRPMRGLYLEADLKSLRYELIVKISEIVRLPVIDKKGQLIQKNANLIFRAWTLLSDQVLKIRL